MYWIEETVLIASLALGLSVYIMILHAIHFCDVVGVVVCDVVCEVV